MDETVYRVEAARAAARKQAAHVTFLARVNEAAALRLHTEIFADIKSLKSNPESNPRYESKRFPDRELHKKLSGKRYWIVFAIQKDRNLVTVVDIQDYQKLI